MADDNNMKTAAPICRAQNPELDVVKRFLFAMPNSVMPKKEYDKVTEARFNGWTSTHYQMAKQMALYYTKDDICYPRFKNDVSTEEIVRYMSRWAKMYYAPNPFTKDLNKYDNVEPTVLYSYFCQCITDGMTSYKDACEKLFGDIHLNNIDKVKLMLNSFTDIYVDSNGQMSFQKWASHEVPNLHPSIDTPLDEESFFNYFNIDSNISTHGGDKSLSPIAQIIYYGCPGTGKSRTVKEKTEGLDDEMIISYDDPELPTNVYRTTFHPDYDYATFVGCYKPVKDDSGLDYRFIPQVFTKAYATACLHPEDPVYLIIEEINRGNCAQIFGDLFQLLDRKEGKSEYPIVPDSELSKYLKTKGVVEYTKLCLPANLHIYATMNTSDQSLFPMDSAFKRRWAMEYVPIDYEKKKAKEFTITLKNDKVYKWVDFLKAVNEKISFATDSEDKQMGEFFIKSSVKSDEFKNKVMFYLWSEICKDLYSTKGSGQKYFMRIEEQKPDPLTGITPLDQFTFSDLFSDRNRNDELLESFFIRLGLYEDGKPESNSVAGHQDTEPVTNE